MKLPCGECKGRCCTYPAMSKREFKVIRKKYGVPKETEFIEPIDSPIVMPVKMGTDRCTYLSASGSCSVYDLRPRVCKLYGEIPAMPCQYLYPEKAQDKVNSLMKKLSHSLACTRNSS